MKFLSLKSIIMKKILLTLFVFLLLIGFQSCDNETLVKGPTNPSPQATNMDAHVAVQWMDLLFNTVAAQDINPPKAARIYGYGAVTLYECVRYGLPNNRSLSGQLNSMPPMPQIGAEEIYDWPSVIAGAMPIVVRGVVDTIENITNARINNIRSIQEQARRNAVGDEIVDRSLLYGESVAQKILDWSRTDRYIETRTMVYTIPPRVGEHYYYWEPTDPVHPYPVEPFWGTLRPFAMKSPSACDVPMAFPCDTMPGSLFYQDAMEVKTIRENLTQEQITIALYWQDKFRTGTPAGHWLSIMNQVVGIEQLGLGRAVEMYALACTAMHDAFISCWESKFRYNLLRPYTYINDYIGSGWTPFLSTPVFPSYTSGHSTQSAAASYVLTELFGNVSFTDTAIARLGFQPRSFSSFNQARDEAIVSRLYGGIHYRTDNERGRDQGILVGQAVMNRVRLKIY